MQKIILDVNQIAAQLFVAFSAYEYPRDDAKNPQETAAKAFDVAECFVQEAFARHQALALEESMGEP